MTEREWAEFWWKRVPGPDEVIRRAGESLSEGRSVVLRLPQDLPWRHAMRDVLRDSLQDAGGMGEVSIDFLDVQDEVEDGCGVAQAIVDRFATPGVRVRYRAGRGLAYDQRFLLGQDVLRNEILWVKGLGGRSVAQWEEFCESWRDKSPEDGLFVLEDRRQDGSVPRGLEVVDYSELANGYSVQLFNGFVLASDFFPTLTPEERRYVAALATSLCGHDVEVANALVLGHDLLGEDPIEAVRATSQGFSDSGRGRSDPAHIVELCRRGECDRVARRVWAAQLEVLYPMIESERLEITDALRDQLDNVIAGHGIDQFGVEVKSADEVELGSLVHLMAVDAETGKRPVNVPDKGLRDRIFLLWTCRNNLAHHKCCSPGQVRRLLSSSGLRPC